MTCRSAQICTARVRDDNDANDSEIKEGGVCFLETQLNEKLHIDDKSNSNQTTTNKNINMNSNESHRLMSTAAIQTSSTSTETYNKTSSITSTHTFILYLTDCDSGGETSLLRRVPGRKFCLTADENTIVKIKPKKGRLLVGTTYM